MEHEAAIKYARAEISNRWKQEGFREAQKNKWRTKTRRNLASIYND